jgi:hypothetical protein
MYYFTKPEAASKKCGSTSLGMQEKNWKICNFMPNGSPQKHGAMATLEQIAGNTAFRVACQFGSLALTDAPVWPIESTAKNALRFVLVHGSHYSEH